MSVDDTIVALSSGALPSGVAVVRLSGPQSGPVLKLMLGHLPPARRLVLAAIRLGGETLDNSLVAWFPGPYSFTGEDCAELHLHGSPAVVKASLNFLTAIQGVRLADAGEFTRRAFENGKLDLTEVEGLGDLIEAETETQRRQALQRLRGGLSKVIDGWRAELIDLRAEIEARLDFSDEGDVGELPVEFGLRVEALRVAIAEAAAATERGRIVREGVRIALAGPPNAGKSSLLNALARSDVAIVTDEPGTTRDVREVEIDLAGRLVVLVDMAGLRETSSKAEAEGVRRARGEIEMADLVLWLVAPDLRAEAPPVTTAPVWHVASKADLGPSATSVDLAVSAATGAGLPALLQRLSAFATELAGPGEPALVSRARDRAALEDAGTALETALQRLDSPELAAEGLRSASHALERLVGRIDAETVLDRLFLSFCIGK